MTIVLPKKKTEEDSALYYQKIQNFGNRTAAKEIKGANSAELLQGAMTNAKNQMAQAVQGKSFYADADENKEDGLSRMIREAQSQTDKLGQQPAVQDAWVDTSYTTWKPATDTVRNDKYISEKTGQLYTDAGGQNWMHTWNGSMQLIDNMTPQEIEDLRQQQLNSDYQLTGRVYKVDENGNAPQWLSIGDQVVTGGGTYVIRGHKPGSGYHSALIDPNQTTGNYSGNYNTGIYGSVLGEQNGFQDTFLGNRESGGEYTGYGGYSINRGNGRPQFDTVAYTFDGEWTRAAVQDGVPYKLNALGELEPMEAGSLVQDASQRYWVVGADGTMIDVTPENPRNNPLNDFSGAVGRIQRQEAEKAGLDLNRQAKEAARAKANAPVDAVTQAQIDQLNLQLERERQNAAAANQSLYRQYRLGQQQLGEQLAGAGLQTTGAPERAYADLTADYMAAVNANQQGVRNAETDTEMQIQMARLQAQQEAEEKALAEERELQAQLLAAQQQAEIDARNAETTARSEALTKANTLAQYGDFSGYAALGYTPEQIANMQAVYAKENAQDTTYQGVGDYALTLLSLYEANPEYDIDAGLQQALQSGLITQQDYTAAMQTAAGLRGIHQQNVTGAAPYAGLSDYAMTLINLYMANPAYDVDGALQQALQSGLITQQDYTAAKQAAAGLRQ